MPDATSDPLQARIVIAGAGSVGCYVGGCLAQAQRNVRFLARPQVAERLVHHGLRVTADDGLDRHLHVRATADAREALAEADVVLVTVKSGATTEIGAGIAQHAPPQATVLSLQNGVRNADVLRAHCGERTVLAGMVPFNVIQLPDAGGGVHVHRATRGAVLVEAGLRQGPELLDVPDLMVRASADMVGVLWGKLLFNLNNALNALSGLPLAQQLADRRWRVLLAAQMREALACFKAAGIRPIGTEGVPPSVIPMVLALPDWLFTRIAGRMLAIDPLARSSMWEDLERRRETEIDFLQGEILALANRHGIDTPVTARVYAAVKAAEAGHAGSPRLAPEAIGGHSASA